MNDRIEAKRKALYQRMKRTPLDAIRAMASMQSRPLPFLTAVENSVELIGQIRYDLPTSEDPNTTYDPVRLANRYVNVGDVNAVSLFTDDAIPHDGTIDMMLVNDTLKHQGIPLISQDYVLHEYHILEARAAGASVVVLTSGLVATPELRLLTSAVHRNRMTAVVSVFSEEQLAAALSFSPQVIGLSSYDPIQSTTDIVAVRTLRQKIPFGQNVIIDRPLTNLRDISEISDLQFDAITVDKTILTDIDAVQKLHVLLKNP